MHRGDPVHDCAVAPSPIVPTYRRDRPYLSSKLRRYSQSVMTGQPDATRTRGASNPRPQARSAGMAERPSRNESLSDLVRFFQTQQNGTPADPASASTASLPSTDSKDMKPLHRRLLQFTQRQKKDGSSKPKVNDQQKQIEALQREGYLLTTPMHKPKGSLDRSLSQSKRQDVENIGQPWLNGPRTSPDDRKRRLASLDLSDFGSMVDVAVSLSGAFDDDSVPPPYQPPAHESSPSSSMIPIPGSTTNSSPIRGPSPTGATDTQHGRLSEDPVQRPASYETSSVRLVSREPARASSTSLPVTQTERTENTQKKDQIPSKPESPRKSSETPGPSFTASQATSASAQHTLKLFPSVAPSRVSSKNARRISLNPQYTTFSVHPPVTPSQANFPENAVGLSERPNPLAAPSTSVQAHDGQAKSSSTSSTAEASANPTKPQEDTADAQSKEAPQPMSMGSTLSAFPLPAPTKPLPSLPANPRSPSAPPDAPAQSTIRMVRSGPMALGIHSLPEEQDGKFATASLRDTRPATALGHSDLREEEEENAPRPNSSHSRSMTPTQFTPRRRHQHMRMSPMQEVPESPSRKRGQDTKDTPLADSPVLGHTSPVKLPRNRAVHKHGLTINPRVDKKSLPFGLPSPPPTANLPQEPPTQRVNAQPARNYTTSSGSSRAMEIPFAPGPYRVSRSNSSRSSLRHESIPEADQPGRSESPLPSSDDEGFGPGTDKTRSRRTVDKRQHTKTTRRVHDTRDARQASAPSRSRQQQQHRRRRSLTPPGRSTHSIDKNASSPQSQYSQSTYRSRDSPSSYRAPASTQSSHFLEDRVANLERQNKILQAALMAALDVSVKNNMDDFQTDPMLTPAFPPAALGNPYLPRFTPRPESWVSSPRSSDYSGFETPSSSFRGGRAKVKQLDNRVEDIESGWTSDKSSLAGPREARTARAS
ncbi:hypothetical protein N7474_002343 [Penicillium riverlandense]|uniref:uncharacterized protein n=1 Tax=Penicillium riverlandense TaxID=1903569 RepID=UPI0025479A65|nr:uncharacterized protein N7474_002343 [Penicillium riverlandense]KAJ5825205.1 hypothetical protein N7474_002343 [Penicillium riverlandense]